MTPPPAGSSVKIFAFKLFASIPVLAIAWSAVHGWANLQSSIDQAAQMFDATADAVGRSPETVHRYLGAADIMLVSVVMLAACFLAWMLIWKASERPDARALALFLIFVFLPDDVLRAALTGFHLGVDDRQLSTLGWVSSWFALAAFLRFSVLFPSELHDVNIVGVWVRLQERRRQLSRKRRTRDGASDGDGAGSEGSKGNPGAADAVAGKSNGSTELSVRLQSALLKAPLVWGGAALLSVATVWLALRSGGITSTWLFVFAILWLGGILRGTQHLRYSYGRSDPDSRRQILWIVYGFYAAMWVVLVIFVVAPVIGVPLYERYAPRPAADLDWTAIELRLLTLPLIIILGSLYIGVFHSGALDPQGVIRRTTIYGIVILTEILLFGVVEGVAERTVIGSVFGEQASNAGTFLAAGVVALAFRPLKHWVKSRVERRLPMPPVRH